MQTSRRRRPARGFRPGQDLAGFDRLEPRRLLDAAGSEDMLLPDIMTFEDETPTTVADVETAEAHVTEATQTAYDISMVAQGQRAPTMEDILKEIDTGKKVALANIDVAISATEVLISRAARYGSKVITERTQLQIQLDAGMGDPDELRRRIAARNEVIEANAAAIETLQQAKNRLQTVRNNTASCFEIMKTRIRALYNQPAEGQAAAIQGYETDDIAIVV